MIHPWLETHWARLIDALRQDRLAHGLLVSGPPGLGKGKLARMLAQTMLCEAPASDGTACGQCHGCRMYLAGTHPDYQFVSPEESASQIKVDQIRDLIRFMALSRQYERYKVAVIEPAQAMNANAANSLLKTLEEPAAYSALVLVTSQPSALPPTVRSRCQRIDVRPPPLADGLAWLKDQDVPAEQAETLLKQANFAPLLASSMAAEGMLDTQAAFFDQLMDVLRGRESLPGMADGWRNEDIGQQLAWQIGWVDQMLRFLATDELELAPEQARVLTRLAPIMGIPGLFDLRDQLIQYRRMLSGNLNAQLLVEDILDSWAQTLDQGKRKTA